MGVDTILSAVKTVNAGTELDLGCGRGSLLFDSIMLSQVEAVEQKLQIESYEQINEILLTNEELQSAGEMFLYLTMCSDTIEPWIVFYNNLFQTQSPDLVLLTLNRLIKGTKTEHFTKIAKALSSSMKMKMFSGTAAENVISQVGNSEVEYLISNHPVHVMTKDNQMSPSAFIPFCDFGGNMSAMGVKIDQFDHPVCNSFQAKIFNDQLCYEVDLNAYYDENNIENQLTLGFHFLIDYNEDRQVTVDQSIKKTQLGLAKSISSSDHTQDAFMYLDTIGKILDIY